MMKTITALLVCFSFAACIEESTPDQGEDVEITATPVAAVPTCETKKMNVPYIGWVCAATRSCRTPGYNTITFEDDNGNCVCECRGGPLPATLADEQSFAE